MKDKFLFQKQARAALTDRYNMKQDGTRAESKHACNTDSNIFTRQSASN